MHQLKHPQLLHHGVLIPTFRVQFRVQFLRYQCRHTPVHIFTLISCERCYYYKYLHACNRLLNDSSIADLIWDIMTESNLILKCTHASMSKPELKSQKVCTWKVDYKGRVPTHRQKGLGIWLGFSPVSVLTHTIALKLVYTLNLTDDTCTNILNLYSSKPSLFTFKSAPCH